MGSESPVLPESTIQRVAEALAGQPVTLAYYLHPLPRGVVSAAQGGLALLFAAGTTPTQRYELAQRLRFQLMGVLPAGQTEMLALNDARLAVAGAALTGGLLVFNRDEAERMRYEMVVLSQMLDFEATARRFLGAGATA